MKKTVKLNNFLSYIRKNRNKLILPIIGLLSLIWFLIRVIPKPSRAMYPCQRAAFPVASAFVIWLLGTFSSFYLYKKAKQIFHRSRYITSFFLIILATTGFFISNFHSTSLSSSAAIGFSEEDFYNKLQNVKDLNNDPSANLVLPMAKVAVVRSSKANVRDLDFTRIDAMIRQAVELAGGLDTIVNDGDIVVLKPNLVSPRAFTAIEEYVSPGANGMLTDYRVIQSVVNIVRELNPNGEIYLMEGSAVEQTEANMQRINWTNITGLDRIIILENESGNWHEYNSDSLVNVHLADGKALYPYYNNSYYLNKIYYEADVLISLPCLKNHWITGVTGGVKNVGIGGTPANIYGASSNIHERDNNVTGINHTYVHEWIHDFFMCRPVDFVIMDGLQGLENGPCAYYFLGFNTMTIADDQKNMRLILAGSDAIAVDAIESLIIGIDPMLVPHLVYLHNDDMGCVDSRYIRVVGNHRVAEIKEDFELAEIGALSKYSDFSSPVFSINSAELKVNELYISLNVDEKINKVEIEIDGIKLDQIVIGDFDNFSIDVSSIESDKQRLVIYAYDKYLNSSSQLATINISGIDTEIEIQNSIRIFPNPATEFLTLELKNEFIGRQELFIYDMTGKRHKYEILDKHSGKIQKTIDINSIPKGNYILEIRNDNISQSEKFRKQ